jgi:hypothetical protein
MESTNGISSSQLSIADPNCPLDWGLGHVRDRDSENYAGVEQRKF